MILQQKNEKAMSLRMSTTLKKAISKSAKKNRCTTSEVCRYYITKGLENE